eukprot:5868492-Prymnesium_polylepis.1
MGWLLDASRGLPQEQQVDRTPQARCDRVLVATVLPRYRRPRLWPRSPKIRRSLHTYHSPTHLVVVRCAVAVQQPTSEAQNASGTGWPNCDRVRSHY